MMTLRALLSAVVLVTPAVALLDQRVPATESSWRCSAQPVEPCFKHRGRLSGQNGIARTIWLVGTTRKVNVRNEEIPSFIEKYLDMTSEDHSYIFGVFEICPVERDVPGHMRAVCVARGEELVVQNLRDARPPFRLLSTWHEGRVDE
jgi:hypothetical protein